MANPQGIVFQGVQRARNVVAQFAAEVLGFIISASAGDGGTVSPAGDTTVEAGGTLRIEAQPNSGFSVSGWSIDGELTPVNADGTDVVITG